VVYATAPQRVYVIDPARPRVIKSIDLGTTVDRLTIGGAGRRALVSLPAAHAVAVIATEYHAEIDRIHFGDDLIGPIATDDSGKRALTATGHVPLAGAREASGGAVYAFDPSRLASAQDRVRASLLGNPVSVLVRPDGETSYVVARAEHALVPLEWLPSGAVRQLGRIPTCREPEQIELVRRDRRAVVRCNGGRALELYDLVGGKLLRHVPLDGRALDVAVTPDGTQAAVAIWADGAGGVALVDLATYQTRMVPLAFEPSRVKLSADGSRAIVFSDRAKTAWVLR
jgi:DNA-binding beta-propeller fold protein YncE